MDQLNPFEKSHGRYIARYMGDIWGYTGDTPDLKERDFPDQSIIELLSREGSKKVKCQPMSNVAQSYMCTVQSSN